MSDEKPDLFWQHLQDHAKKINNFKDRIEKLEEWKDIHIKGTMERIDGMDKLEQKIENCITLPELEGNIEAFTERIDTLSAVIKEFIQWTYDYTYKIAIAPPLMKFILEALLKRLDGEVWEDNLLNELREKQLEDEPSDWSTTEHMKEDLENMEKITMDWFKKSPLYGKPKEEQEDKGEAEPEYGFYKNNPKIEAIKNKLIAEFLEDLWSTNDVRPLREKWESRRDKLRETEV